MSYSKPTRTDLRNRLDAAAKQAERERRQDAYVYRRRREMPSMLQATRRKLAMLENEARSYGLNPEAM